MHQAHFRRLVLSNLVKLVRNLLQNVAQLYSMLRCQAFDLHEPNPRMLPRQFNPQQLNVECTPPSPVKEETLPPNKTKAKLNASNKAAVSSRLELLLLSTEFLTYPADNFENQGL